MDNITDIIEEKGEGTCRVKNGKVYLMYKSVDDNETQSTTVIAEKNSVQIKRNGSVKSDIKYIPAEKTAFRYYMPYGIMDMEVITDRIENELSEDGGKLRIVYILTVQGGRYYNDMEITVTKRKE